MVKVDLEDQTDLEDLKVQQCPLALDNLEILMDLVDQMVLGAQMVLEVLVGQRVH